MKDKQIVQLFVTNQLVASSIGAIMAEMIKTDRYCENGLHKIAQRCAIISNS